MKKIILTVGLAFSLAATHAHAQGTVNFGNNSSTAITNPLTMMRVVAGTFFRVALYYLPDQPIAPTREEMELFAIQIGASAPIAPAAGLYAAGTRTTPSTTPGAGFAWFQVRLWEYAFGTTYEAARDNPIPINGRHSCVATSNIMRVKTGDPVNNITPGALTAFGLQPMIFCVPEPSSFVLAAMGIGALLLWRRRN